MRVDYCGRDGTIISSMNERNERTNIHHKAFPYCVSLVQVGVSSRDKICHRFGQSSACAIGQARVSGIISSRPSNCGDVEHFKRASPRRGLAQITAGPRDDDDGSVQPVAILLNISVVGGWNEGSESLATF
jgi:hypothetical protein